MLGEWFLLGSIPNTLIWQKCRNKSNKNNQRKVVEHYEHEVESKKRKFEYWKYGT